MVPLQNFATGVLAEIIKRQPPSRERTSFAWTVAVGPALARTTTATLEDTVLTVRARDPRWAREVQRAADTILRRMQHLLGAGSVAKIEIVS
jgi:predicted nucleic acid-binding Zn ribbon protein